MIFRRGDSLGTTGRSTPARRRSRILNRELEPKGYRILEKGQFLTVLAMKEARSTYRRPVSPLPASLSRDITPVAHAEGEQALDRTAPTARQLADATRTQRRFESLTQQLKSESGIRQASAVAAG